MYMPSSIVYIDVNVVNGIKIHGMYMYRGTLEQRRNVVNDIKIYGMYIKEKLIV